MVWSGIPCLEAVEVAPMRKEWPENSSGEIPDFDRTCQRWWWNQRSEAKLVGFALFEVESEGVWRVDRNVGEARML